jgi:gliding motility-associated-like protein
MNNLYLPMMNRFRLIALTVFAALYSLNSTHAAVYYVDTDNGDDTYNGLFAVFTSGSDGPKKTINGGLNAANPGDTLHIAKGYYHETVVLSATFFWETADTVMLKTLIMDGMGEELVLFGHSLYLRDSLHFIAGIITPDDNFIFATKEYAHCNIGNENSYVNGFYYLENGNPFVGNLIFPVGSQFAYRPVVMNLMQTTYDETLYGFKLVDGAPPSAGFPSTLGQVSRVQHWELKHIGLAVPYDVALYVAYDTAGRDDEVYDIDSVHMAFLPYGGSMWKDLHGIGTVPRKGNLSNSWSADTTGYFALANSPNGHNHLGHPEPFAQFSFSVACEGADIAFTDRSVDHKDSIVSWFWDFGTGNSNDTTSIRNPTFNYPVAGIYQVKLTISNSLGFMDTILKPVTIHPRPVPAFTPDTVCPGSPATFNSLSTVPIGSITGTDWYFGDGNAGSGDGITHTYSGSGMYTAKLISTTNRGCRDSVTAVVRVLPAASPFIGKSNICSGDTANLFSAAGTPADTISSWSWFIAGIPAGNAETIAYAPALPGKYPVLLEVVTGRGCRDTARDTFEMFPKPGPIINVQSACAGGTVSISGSGGFAGDPIAFWEWHIDGVSASFNQSFQTTPSGSGKKGLRLIVLTGAGCRDTISDSLTLFPGPQVRFSLDPGIAGNDSIQCAKGNRFSLIDASTPADTQTIASAIWRWNGGGTPAGSSNAFTSSGVKTVTLVVSTSQGCTDSLTRQYVVKPAIDIRWGHLNNCLPSPIVFNDLTVQSGFTITQRLWEFGDGNFRFASTPSIMHSYVSAGDYDVSLIITTDDGCRDTLTKTLTFGTLPSISIIPTGNIPFCRGDSLLLSVQGGNSVQWFDGDTTRDRWVKEPGFYRATTFSSALCSVSDSFRVTVFNNPTADAGRDTVMYRNKPIVLFGSGGVNFRWEPAALCITPNAASTEINPPTDTSFILRVIDGNGCIGFDTVNVRVLDIEPPAPVAIIPNMITPNNDGMNDAWDLRGVPDLSNCAMFIYNGYGKLVYEYSGAYNHDWTGTDQAGKTLDQGTYLYILESKQTGKTYKGYLFINRQ